MPCALFQVSLKRSGGYIELIPEKKKEKFFSLSLLFLAFDPNLHARLKLALVKGEGKISDVQWTNFCKSCVYTLYQHSLSFSSFPDYLTLSYRGVWVFSKLLTNVIFDFREKKIVAPEEVILVWGVCVVGVGTGLQKTFESVFLLTWIKRK